MPTDTEPIFERRGDLVVPTGAAQGPWGETVGGRWLSGLVAWGAARDHDDDDYLPARLTVDMFRPVPLVPIRVVSTLVRRGRRIRVIDVSARDEAGLELVRGTVMQLLKTENPPGAVWYPRELGRLDPEALPPWPPRIERERSWQMRRVGREAWVKESQPFVAGEKLTPFLRAALAADATNGTANDGEGGLGYINADLALYLARLPRSEWVGLEGTGHGGDCGVSYGTASMYDLEGRIGQVTMAGLADLRLYGRQGFSR